MAFFVLKKQSRYGGIRQGGHTESQVFWNFRSTWHTHRQVPIVRQVRPVRQVRHSLLPPCALRKVPCQPTEHTALCYRNSKAHGTHCTMCRLPSEASGEGGSVQVRTSPYKSVFPCPQYRHCAKCPASQQPPPLCIAPAVRGYCGVSACNTAGMVIYYFEANCG